MNRREAIQKASLLFGVVVSSSAMAGAMGQKTNLSGYYLADAFQEKLLAEVADIIIPTTTTPGAKAAGVEKFISRVMRDCYSKADQEKFYAGLARLNTDCTTKFGKEFIDLENAQKIEMVKMTTVNDKPFFLRMKELTVTGYFTSEIGATQALNYLPIPGKFEPCTTMPKGQKAWAL